MYFPCHLCYLDWTIKQGFPGWGVRDSGLWRTSNASYVSAYDGYLRTINEIFARNQITNGGPIILYQARIMPH